MSAGAARAGAFPAAPGGAGISPWLIALLVSFATFMEVLDATIVNVALPHVAGGLGVSEDQASWVVTTYLVSNAIILTASSFLARLLGRKTFFLICLALFTTSSVLCGFAWNLQSLLSILQGLAGGGMVPVSQSILADSFPPSKRGQAFALFGVAVVVAPVIGPTLGGWLFRRPSLLPRRRGRARKPRHAKTPCPRFECSHFIAASGGISTKARSRTGIAGGRR